MYFIYQERGSAISWQASGFAALQCIKGLHNRGHDFSWHASYFYWRTLYTMDLLKIVWLTPFDGDGFTFSADWRSFFVSSKYLLTRGPAIPGCCPKTFGYDLIVKPTRKEWWSWSWWDGFQYEVEGVGDWCHFPHNVWSYIWMSCTSSKWS
jgi:hypothetical protein